MLGVCATLAACKRSVKPETARAPGETAGCKLKPYAKCVGADLSHRDLRG
jgi:hypothetical protein